MSAMLLAAVLYAASAEADPLLDQLQAEFDKLVEGAPHARDLRKAELYLRRNQDSHWTDARQAMGVLRAVRSKAAVPLLLKYMIVHSESRSADRIIPEYANTIALLTGEKIDNPYHPGPDAPKMVRQHVEKLFREWWLPKKNVLGTDPGKMSREKLEVVVDRLVQKMQSERDYSGSGGREATAYRVYHVLFYEVMNRNSSEQWRWKPEGLHADLAPVLLARAGYRPAGEADPDFRGPDEVSYPIVELLAELRKNQEAPLLDKIAADPRQCSAARLTCILAMYAAGEELDTQSLISVLDTEKRLKLRLVNIMAFIRSENTEGVAPRLIKLLDDRNVEIRTAAVCALRGPKPPEAVPKLKEMIDKMDPVAAMTFIFDVIGEIGTEEAKQALADFMRDAQKNSQKVKRLYNALGAFQTATGKRWYGAGAHDEAYYRERALEALAWWDRPQPVPEGPAALDQLQSLVDKVDTDRDGRIDALRTKYLRGSEPLLVCVKQTTDDGSLKTVANSIYYLGQVAYTEVLEAGDPPAFTACSYAKSRANVGVYSDAESDSNRILLFDPKGTVVAIFRRESGGQLKPVAAEEFQRVRRKYQATHPAARKLFRETVDKDPFGTP